MNFKMYYITDNIFILFINHQSHHVYNAFKNLEKTNTKSIIHLLEIVWNKDQCLLKRSGFRQNLGIKRQSNDDYN